MRAVRGSCAAAGLLLAVVVAGCGGSEPPGSPGTDGTAAAALTAHPVPSGDAVVATSGALVDQDLFATNDAGDLLTAVVVDTPGSSSEWCQTTDAAALVWNGHDGGRRTWTGDVTARQVAATPGGFVVGAVLPDCHRSAAGPHGDPGAYLVTGSGDTVEITWPGGRIGAQTRQLCAAHPADVRCVFSVERGTATLRPKAGTAPHHGMVTSAGDLLVGRTDDPHDVWWSSDDGTTWQQRHSSLDFPRGAIYLTGDVPVLSNGTTVEYSLDGGRTWSSRELDRQVDQVGLTTTGVLLAVLLPQRRDLWSDYQVVRFAAGAGSEPVTMPPRAWYGPLWVTVHGNAVYVFNHPDLWWISTDAGAHWRVVAPLASVS